MAFDTITHQGEIKKFLKKQKNPDAVRLELKEFYEQTTPIHGIRVNHKFLIIDRAAFRIMNTSDILWVYHLNTKSKMYGVLTVGSFHAVVFRTSDGADNRVVVSTAKSAEELIHYLFPILKQAFFGYNAEIVKIWNEGEKDQHMAMRILGQMQHERKGN